MVQAAADESRIALLEVSQRAGAQGDDVTI
jgi:hypothetical protein